jgi:hypothetical protein
MKEAAMYGHAVPKGDEETLKRIIRSVDKKLSYSLLDGVDAAESIFTLHLSTKGWEGTLIVALNDLQAAKNDLACRNRLRQRIKRLRDHMWDNRLVKDVMGTKVAGMLKAAGQQEAAFRPQFMRRSPRR